MCCAARNRRLKLNQTERIGDYEDAVSAKIRGALVEMWTCMPAIVNSWDSLDMTVSAQISVMTQTRDNVTGVWSDVTISVLVKLPVIFQNGGGLSLTFPIAQGDECVIKFADRCFDNWWLAGGVQSQAEFRIHDIHDGFAEVGPRSQPRVIPAISSTAAELRTDDGTAAVAVGLDHSIRLTAPGGLAIFGVPPVASATEPTLSIPVNVGGVVIYLKASFTP